MGSEFTVRPYAKTDWETVSKWWNGHDSKRVLLQEALPPAGVMVENEHGPLVALWVHLSAGVGVAFLENPVSKPLQDHVIIEEAFSVAIGAIEAICREHDYGLIIANTLPAIARWMNRQMGFEESGVRVQMTKFLNHGT